MLHFLRRRRTADPAQVSLCESCAKACTPACRAAEHDDRMRTAALIYSIPR